LEKSSKGAQMAINAKANGGPMKKDDMDPNKKDDKSPDAAPDAAPSADASSAAPAAQDQGAPAADAAPAPSDSAPNGDPQGPPADAGQPGEGDLQQQPEMSDEELHEIYGSMPHEELERHFMAIRSLLQDAYAQQDGSQAAGEAAPAPADPSQDPSQAPPAMMGKDEKDASKKDESMDKAEKVKLEALEKSNSEMKHQIELLSKAVEAGFRPQRKSIEGIDYIRKGEGDAGTPAELSKSEITEKLGKVEYGKLSKNDREAINTYMLYDDKSAKAHVEKILGGK
jgi:hypothetical protein